MKSPASFPTPKDSKHFETRLPFIPPARQRSFFIQLTLVTAIVWAIAVYLYTMFLSPILPETNFGIVSTISILSQGMTGYLLVAIVGTAQYILLRNYGVPWTWIFATSIGWFLSEIVVVGWLPSIFHSWKAWGQGWHTSPERKIYSIKTMILVLSKLSI